jgi:hypothetical protein
MGPFQKFIASSTKTNPAPPMLLNFQLFSLGPFLRTILLKLENMLQNSLHVNLLLTGIISRLAHYSQPLLRSLLLNHSLVLDTNVKSLFQVNKDFLDKFIKLFFLFFCY